MSAGGHMMDMMNRIRQNAALKVSRRNKFKGNNRETNFSKKKSSKPEYDFPKVTSSELKLIKAKIKEEAIKERKKQLLILMLFAIAVTIVFLTFNYY